MRRTATAIEIGIHAVDLGFVRTELVPWVLGEFDGNLPRCGEMARSLHTRYQANVVGRALVQDASNMASERERASRVPSLRQRLFNRADAPVTVADILERVDVSDVFGSLASNHLLERPFLLANHPSQTTPEQRRSLSGYLQAQSDNDVKSIIEYNVDRLGLDPHVREQALAAFTGNEYDELAARDYAESSLTAMRKMLDGRSRDPDDGTLPRQFKLEPILTELVRAAAHTGCSWLLRGVSPSYLLEASGVRFFDMQDAFCFADGLLPALPWLAWDIQQVLEHPGIGAVVEAEHVADFRSCLHANRARIRPFCADREWALLDECLAHATAEGLDLVESTGIIRTQEGCLP